MRMVFVMVGLLIAGLVAWYEFLPLYTLNEMRKAAAAGNTIKLSNWVDYEALKIDMKGELRREILLSANRSGLADTPIGKFGADLAVALVPAGVELVVTPEAIQAMFDATSSAKAGGRGFGVLAKDGVAIMPVGIPKKNFKIERVGLGEFKVRVKGKRGAAIFRRHGWSWKLAGVDMPYRFGPSTPL